MINNPLMEGLQFTKEPDPFIVTIFGATGDLTQRKLIPALFSLFIKGNITRFKIVGFARRSWTPEDFKTQVKNVLANFQSVPLAQKTAFLEKLDFISSTFNDPQGYNKLKDLTQEWTGKLFYLSTPPDEYHDIITNLGISGLSRQENGWTRVIVEKPFGRDLSSAKELNDTLAKHFDTHQIYPIDHYLGKETVQNILVLRFGNGIFEPLWNSRYIDHIQITVSESLGVLTRGNYYEKSGALRDMVQNHIFQLLTLLTMEPPNDLSPQMIRVEKLKVLKSLRPISHKDVGKYTVRAQYTEGILEGKNAIGYREENGVAPNSRTETFVALKIFLDTWRWAGVPIYIRTGKALAHRMSEVALIFKQPPLQMFQATGSHIPSNSLVIRIQPDEGISFQINSKIPGYSTHVRPVNMDFAYSNTFGESTPEAYERLLLDALVGDSTLYPQREEIETSWSFITRILQGWAEDKGPIPQYKAGSSGPEEAKALFEGHGQWRKL